MKVNELIEQLRWYNSDSEVAIVCNKQTFEGVRVINENLEIFRVEDEKGNEILIIEEVEI